MLYDMSENINATIEGAADAAYSETGPVHTPPSDGQITQDHSDKPGVERIKALQEDWRDKEATTPKRRRLNIRQRGIDGKPLSVDVEDM
jgi:hypothetical protein